MKKFTHYLCALGACLAITAGASAQTAVDLNTWSQKGPAGNGTWNVDASGDFVVQTTNGNPTYFVSPNDFFNTTIEGKFEVQTTSDDDFIGFVFGWNEPGENSSDATFNLLNWKQNTQTFNGTTEAGFRLAKVNGTNTPPFGDAEDDNLPDYDVLAINTTTSNPGGIAGWADNTEYDFSLLYTEDRIKVDVTGGTGIFQSGVTVFDVAPGDVGLAAFESGKFGFYNHSQSNVRYESFTLTEPALATDPGDTETLEFLARVGDSDQQAVNVSNTGGAGTTLTGNADSPAGPLFSGPAESPGFSLGSGEDTDFTYTYSPTARGMDSDSIDIVSNEDGTHTIALSGQGVGPEFDSDIAAGTTIDFGNLDLDATTMQTIDLTISNITDDPNGDNDDLTALTLTGFDITGPDSDKFDLLTALDAILKGDDLVLMLKFNPMGMTGDFDAMFTLFTDEGAPLGGDGNDYSWDLSGSAFNNTGGPIIPTPAALPAGLALLGVMTLRRRKA